MQIFFSRARILVPNITVALLGIVPGIILFTEVIPGEKWLLAATACLTFLLGLFVITRDFKLTFIALAVFTLPIRLDFHLIFKHTNFSQIKGLPITLFDFSFLILCFIWIVDLISKRKPLNFYWSISLAAFAYIAFAGLSAFWSLDKVLSFSMLLLIIKSYIVFLYFANNIRTEKEISWIVAMLSVGILLQSFIGILQHFSGGTLGLQIFGEGERAFRTTTIGLRYLSRVGGTIGGANSLAMYLNLFLPVILCLTFSNVSPKLKLVAGMSFVFGSITELFTLSRGGWVALSFGILLALYGILKERYKSKIQSLVMAGMGLLFAAILTVGLIPDVRHRLFKDDYAAAYARIPMMKVAFNLIKDNPFTGVGLNNYTSVMNSYDRTRDKISYRFPYPVHNAFLIIAGESGLLALFCFLLLLFAVFGKAAKFFQLKDRFLYLIGIGFFSGILTWIIHAQVRMDFAGINTALWFSIGMITALNHMLTCANNPVYEICNAPRDKRA